MPDFGNVGSLLLFLVFFIPGFIAVRVYGLIIAREPTDFSKQIPEVVGYSSIHYSLTLWLYFISPIQWRPAIGYLIVLILPVLWPPLLILLKDTRGDIDVEDSEIPKASRFLSSLRRRFDFLKGRPRAYATAWDAFFAKASYDEAARGGFYVRIRTVHDKLVGGFYGGRSSSSTYPNPNQLYLERAYVVHADGSFHHIDRSAGLLINGSEIAFIEFINRRKSET